MATESELSSMLFTNQDRFERVCRILENGEGSSLERLLAIKQDALDIDKYKYRAENLTVKTLVGAAKRAIKCYIETDPSDDPVLLELLNGFVSAKKDDYYYSALSELSKIQTYFKSSSSRLCGSVGDVVFLLLDIVWHYTSMQYFWLRRNKS